MKRTIQFSSSVPRKKKITARRGFTLIELLVVIAIISMLAAQLMPALSMARERGRQANCINNLHQISMAIEIYFQDFRDYPPWLSTLFSSYLNNPAVFTCTTDSERGIAGNGHYSFPETNDIPPENIPGAGYSPPYEGAIAGFNYRNSDITACSYIYEFNQNECSWFMSGKTLEEIGQADLNGDGSVSWKEAKLWQAASEGWQGRVPIVRCFWHQIKYNQKVLNLAYNNYNVYPSEPEWETSSH